MNNVLILILGMAIVTYIPRLLPFIMVDGKQLSPKLEKFLTFIPYTALGALIFPGVLTAIPEMPLAASAGIAFAFLFAWYKGSVIIPVLGSILVSFLVLLIGS